MYIIGPRAKRKTLTKKLKNNYKTSAALTPTSLWSYHDVRLVQIIQRATFW
jgi:hypothetical protein